MTVIKRDSSSSSRDLTDAIDSFCELLQSQKEDEAIAALKECASLLRSNAPKSEGHVEAINKIIDAFEGEHELEAYILQKSDPSQWTVAEQLSQAATRVLNLARRFK